MRTLWATLNFIWAWLTQFCLDWVVPVLMMIVVLPLTQIVVFINPWVGAVVLLILGSLVAAYTAWRGFAPVAITIAITSGLLSILALLSPAFFQPLVFALVALATLIILGVPGLVLSVLRPGLWGLLIVEAALSLLLMAGTMGGALPALVLLAGLAFLTSVFVSWGAMRPWEQRRARRATGQWLTFLAVLFLVLAFRPAWEGAARSVTEATGQAISSTTSSVGEWLDRSPMGWWWKGAAIRAEKSAWDAVPNLVDSRALGRAALEEEEFLKEKRKQEIRQRGRADP